MNPTEYYEAIRRAEELDPVLAVARARHPQSLDQGSPFSQVRLNLADTDWGTINSRLLTLSGHGLYYRREGSVPGGRLNINLGGQLADFYPGATIKGWFKQFEVSRSSRSAAAGLANLVVLGRPDAEFLEPRELVGEPFEPVNLLGSLVGTVFTYVTVAEDTQPTGATPTGSFLCRGFTRIRLMIDTLSAAANATSAELIPWAQVGGEWFDQRSASFSLVDSASTAYRYRVIELPVLPAAVRMFFEIRTLLAAGRTGLDQIVQGVG